MLLFPNLGIVLVTFLDIPALKPVAPKGRALRFLLPLFNSNSAPLSSPGRIGQQGAREPDQSLIFIRVHDTQVTRLSMRKHEH